MSWEIHHDRGSESAARIISLALERQMRTSKKREVRWKTLTSKEKTNNRSDSRLEKRGEFAK